MNVHESSSPYAYRQLQGNEVNNPHIPFPSCLWCWESWISLDQVTHRMRYQKTHSHPLIPCFHFTVKDPYLCQARAGVFLSAHKHQRSLWVWQGPVSFPHLSILPRCVGVDLLILRRVPAEILNLPKIIQRKEHFCMKYFYGKFCICSRNTGSWVFCCFLFSLSSSDIAKLCSNLVGIGETKQKIIEGLLVNLNFSEARTCAVKQSEIQELSPSVCTLPWRGLCHFFEAGSILMGKTPEDDVNL